MWHYAERPRTFMNTLVKQCADAPRINGNWRLTSRVDDAVLQRACVGTDLQLPSFLSKKNKTEKCSAILPWPLPTLLLDPGTHSFQLQFCWAASVKIKLCPESYGERSGQRRNIEDRALEHITFSTYSVHLTQYCAFPKKEWFPCIH